MTAAAATAKKAIRRIARTANAAFAVTLLAFVLAGYAGGFYAAYQEFFG